LRSPSSSSQVRSRRVSRSQITVVAGTPASITTDAVTNEGNGPGDAVGDVLTFTNEVFDKSNSHKVGSDQGYCVRMVVGESWECVFTTLLSRGQLTVEGPFYDTRDSVLAITGGTGAYANARGSMELRSRAGGTEFAFIFHLIG
jgi:allene oxide cyclase